MHRGEARSTPFRPTGWPREAKHRKHNGQESEARLCARCRARRCGQTGGERTTTSPARCQPCPKPRLKKQACNSHLPNPTALSEGIADGFSSSLSRANGRPGIEGCRSRGDPNPEQKDCDNLTGLLAKTD